MKIVRPSVVMEAITPNAARVIEAAGRTCYKSEDKADAESAVKFIRMIRERGHDSVLEHASATFRVVCDRGVTHEIVRHRIASYSQESTRYCNYDKEKFGREITVIRPPGLEPADCNCGPSDACDQCQRFLAWKSAVETAEQEYLFLLRRGVKPEIARSVLPTCLKTEIVMTANFREWLHFIKLRTGQAAHPQMREVAGLIEMALRGACPEVFA